MAEGNTLPYDAADGHAAGPAFAQVAEQVHSLLAAGQHDDAIAFLFAALAAVLRKSRQLELLLLKLRRTQRATRSEKISPEQLALLLEEFRQLAVAEPEYDAEAEAREDAELREEIERRMRPPGRPAKNNAHAAHDGRAGTRVRVSSVRSTRSRCRRRSASVRVVAASSSASAKT